VGLFTRPRVNITVNADGIDVQGLRSRSGLEPVFHVIRQAATPPWVIVGAPGLDLVQPAQFALHLFRRHEWPSDAVPMWGDFVMLMFGTLLPRRSALPWRRPNVHVRVRAPISQHDRGEFETRGRVGLAYCGARSVDFQWG
jgi:hypothetical protein